MSQKGKILINENDIFGMVKSCLKILLEDVYYTPNNDGSIDVQIKHGKDETYDRLDDRMFCRKRDVLNNKFMKDNNRSDATKTFYNQIIGYINNGLKGRYPKCSDNLRTQTAFVNRMKFYTNGGTVNRYNGKNYPTIEALYKANIKKENTPKGGICYVVKYNNKNQGGRNGTSPQSFKTIEDAISYIDKNMETVDTILSWAKLASEKDDLWRGMRANKIERLQKYNNDDKIANYEVITLPDSNIKAIALWKMGDFNFSDALKHGELRQNGMTDSILGIDSDSRKIIQTIEPTKGSASLKKIPATYDNGGKPNISKNFSLNGFDSNKDGSIVPNGGHFKQQFSKRGSNDYNSIMEFLDKSVQYAAYSLKDYGFKPSFLISVPSSSKYNMYFCANLSNKLGVPYIHDFLERNVIDVKFDENKLYDKGFSESEIKSFKDDVKNAVFSEIGIFLKNPIKEFCKVHSKELNQIGSPYGFDYNSFIPYITQNAFRTILSSNMSIFNDEIYKNMLPHIFDNMNIGKTNKNYNLAKNRQIIKEETAAFLNKVSSEFYQYVQRVFDIMQKYKSQIYSENGYKFNLYSKAFKITSMAKRFRPFLQSVYIVKGKYTTTDAKRKGALLGQFSRSDTKFLIFDEDINSGGSLLLAVNGLKDQIVISEMYKDPNADYETVFNRVNSELQNKVLCLVNGYSNTGF